MEVVGDVLSFEICGSAHYPRQESGVDGQWVWLGVAIAMFLQDTGYMATI